MRKLFYNPNLCFKLFQGFLLLICFLTSEVNAQSSSEYDIVLIGGRVIDPETGLDGIQNIGISGGTIKNISSQPLKGIETLDVSGLTVAPGFIDLHVHGLGITEQLYKIHDGVTTFFELEAGLPFLDAWHNSVAGKMLINYGASASWQYIRGSVIKDFKDQYAIYEKRVNELDWIEANLPIGALLPTNYMSVSKNNMPLMIEGIKKALEDGAIGIAVPIQYVPSADREEVFRLYQIAGKMHVPIITHVRPYNTMGIQQAISDAVVTGAPLHICHINSIALKEIELAIEMVDLARKRGFDISMEMYPYTASSTNISSALFDEGWQEVQGITYEDLQWVETGERLTKQTFEKYRESSGWVILHKMKPEWIRKGIASKNVIIASDGMPYSSNAHPRTAGTFSRALGKYVREEKVLSLIDAIGRMTLLPAQRLEEVAPSMRMKGRIQVGADADITIFDPETIIDNATFEKGLANSTGVQHVIVNGVFVLKNNEITNDLYPGKPVFGKYKK